MHQIPSIEKYRNTFISSFQQYNLFPAAAVYMLSLILPWSLPRASYLGQNNGGLARLTTQHVRLYMNG